ncbi:zinc finger CCCH domain-containing protein 9 [Ditylenchus destructor]|nr:zinc finger CCCH domain-containing protein 9 [Ditylenchus destructor]
MRKSPSKTTNSTNFQQSADFSDMADSKYKTKLCRIWEETADCSDGICCKYAHGESELQPLLSPICRTIAEKGMSIRR